MKKILIILTLFIFHSYFCSAQNETVQDASRIEKLKKEYLTRQLHLTPAESGLFWVVYKRYNTECKMAWKESNNNANMAREKTAIIKDNYRPSFINILHSHERANDVYRAERDFRVMVNKTLQERKR